MDMRNRGALIVVGIIGVLIVGAAGWYFVSPLLFDRTVDEEAPFQIPSAAELEEMPDEEQQELAAEVQSTAAAMEDKPMDETMPEADVATVLKLGTFVDADNFHKGSGIATIFELSDGSQVLRFEEFTVTNGPDLHVYLATGNAPTGRDDLGEFLDLGELKGNVGDQNYEIPAGMDLTAYQSIVIYCVPFHVVFSIATLSG
jgi:hypothetical protein